VIAISLFVHKTFSDAHESLILNNGIAGHKHVETDDDSHVRLESRREGIRSSADALESFGKADFVRKQNRLAESSHSFYAEGKRGLISLPDFIQFRIHIVRCYPRCDY